MTNTEQFTLAMVKVASAYPLEEDAEFDAKRNFYQNNIKYTIDPPNYESLSDWVLPLLALGGGVGGILLGRNADSKFRKKHKRDPKLKRSTLFGAGGAVGGGLLGAFLGSEFREDQKQKRQTALEDAYEEHRFFTGL